MHPVPTARRLAAALEPTIGSVFFLPEIHEAYVALGFGGSGGERDGVAMPDGPAYVHSRASALGTRRPTVVAAAFGVFSTRIIAGGLAVGPQVEFDELARVRVEATAAGLERILGPADDRVDEVAEQLLAATAALDPAGRPLYSGLRDLPVPADGWARLHRAGDLAREFRGDSHTAAWATRGLDACQMGLLTEAWWGMPLRTYARTRGWTSEEFAAAEGVLESSGLLDGGALTTAGRELREVIEQDTDRQCEPLVAGLGEHAEALIETMRGWSLAVQEAKGYPAAGPLSLAP